MWAVSTQRVAATLRILVDLGQSTTVGALKVWNYNAGLEGTYVGVRRLAVTLDGRRLSPPEGFLIRKAPGNDSFDFGQFVDFSPGSNSVNTPVHKQQGRRFDDVSFNKENDHQSVLSEADWDDESMLMESLSGVSVARVAPIRAAVSPATPSPDPSSATRLPLTRHGFASICLARLAAAGQTLAQEQSASRFPRCS